MGASFNLSRNADGVSSSYKTAIRFFVLLQPKNTARNNAAKVILFIIFKNLVCYPNSGLKINLKLQKGSGKNANDYFC
jgi:hypothetical protein